MITDLLKAFGRKILVVLAMVYVSFGVFAYWQADPGSDLKLFLFEFTKAGGQKAQSSGLSIDLSQKPQAALPGSIAKACQDAIMTSAEEESELLLNGSDEGGATVTEIVGLCERNSRQQGTIASKLLLARSLAMANRPTEARAIFEDLAEKGDSHSNLVLGFIYSDYKDRAPMEAISHFVKALAAGEPYGAYGLGKYFEIGMHDLPDYVQAAAMYQLVSAEIPEAQFRLGQLYQFGLGVPKNNKEAIKLLRSAASSGYAPAVSVLRSIDEKR